MTTLFSLLLIIFNYSHSNSNHEMTVYVALGGRVLDRCSRGFTLPPRGVPLLRPCTRAAGTSTY